MALKPFILEFSIDDGNIDDLRVARLLERYGFKGIFYIAPFYTKVPIMSVRQIKELGNKHEIGGHTVNHILLTNASDEEALKEINGGKTILEDIIEKKITKFAYPRGWCNERIKRLVEGAGFERARTMKLGITNIEGYDRYGLPISAHLYPRLEYRDRGIYTSIIAVYDRARREGNYFNLVMHSVELNRYELWNTLEEILKFIRNYENKNSPIN